MKKQLSESEKLAKNLNTGMRFAGWVVLIVIMLTLAVCGFVLF